MKHFIMLILAIFALAACSPENIMEEYPPIEDDISEEEYCIAMEGTWDEFPNACADTCSFHREEDAMCAQVITESCDCGPEMCWTGTACVPI